MTCSGCSRLEVADAATVTLLTGEVVCTWCPAWQVETRDREVLARTILAMDDKGSRLVALARHEAADGTESRRRLEAAIMGLWQIRKTKT